MGLRIERIPTLGDNYTYLLVCEATGEAAVVDAPEAEPVLRRVEALGARVTKILSTHHHGDHSAANPELAKRYDAPVFGHASDSGRLPGQTEGLEEGDTRRRGPRDGARALHPGAHARPHRLRLRRARAPSSAATRCSRPAAGASSRARPR